MTEAQKTKGEEYSATVVSMTGTEKSKLHLLVNFSPKVGDPESITSTIDEFVISPDRKDFTVIHRIDSWVSAMDETRNGTLAAVTMDGELVVRRAGKWTTRDLGCADGIQGIWLASEKVFFAAGASGERIRISGNDVDLSPEREKRSLYGVHGTSPSYVVMVGDDGAVFRYNGKTWEESEAPTNKNLMAVHCRSEKEIYIAGAEGALFRGDGQDWEKLQAPDAEFYAIEWFQGALYMAAGEDGVFRVVQGSAEPFKKLPTGIYGLKTTQDQLQAYGSNFIAGYNGTKWSGGFIEF